MLLKRLTRYTEPVIIGNNRPAGDEYTEKTRSSRDEKHIKTSCHMLSELTPAGAAFHRASATAQSPLPMVLAPRPWLECHYGKP